MEMPDALVALDHAFDSCALFDRSDLARLLGTGPDLLDLLHRLSTGAVREMTPGAGKPTVITTPKGRIVDLLFVHHLGEQGVLLNGGAGCAERVAAHLDRFTFAEQTGLRDITAETYQFAIVGPAATQALRSCGLEPPAPYDVMPGSIGGKVTHVIGQDGFEAAGFSVIGPIADSPDVQAALAEAVHEAGGGPADRGVLETYRILRGLPLADHELTDEHNPLEAGLREAVGFDKGCYVGQEVVARLNTYDKVTRSIVGLELQDEGVLLPQIGTTLLLEGRTVGVLTSAVLPPGSEFALGLGYVKRKELQPDLLLQLGENGPAAKVVELPFRRSRVE